MLILAVDTSTQAGSVAVLRDERVLGVVSTWVEETYSSRMFRHLEFLLEELSIKTGQFDLFAVAAGPGSFSGLRVGLAAAKAWAEVHQKPIAAVSALEAVAAQVYLPAIGEGERTLLVPMIDARRGQVYASVYRPTFEDPTAKGLIRQGDESVMEPGEFLAALRDRALDAPVIFATPTPEILTVALAASSFRGSPVLAVSPVLAPAIGILGLAHARRGELVDALHLEANYVRRSDAELVFKATRA
jgi:tRNA threonylcarbamoyladenosine biosynthesis protein TsaB